MGLLLALMYISFLGMLGMVYLKMPAIRMEEGVPVRSNSGVDQIAEFADQKVRFGFRATWSHVAPFLRFINTWLHLFTYHAAEKTGRNLTRLSRSIKGRNAMRDNRGSVSLFLRDLRDSRGSR